MESIAYGTGWLLSADQFEARAHPMLKHGYELYLLQVSREKAP